MNGPPGTDARPRIRVTPRGFVLLAFAVALIVGAVALRSPAALLAAVPLLIAPLAAATSRPTRLSSVSLAWHTEGLGPDLQIRGTLVGSFGRSTGDIAVRVPTVPGARRVGPTTYVRGPTEISFTDTWNLAEPMVAVLPAPEVWWRDPLGLLEHLIGGERPSLAVERYPPELHRLGAIRLDRTLQLPGEARSRRLGSSGEFFGIREATVDEPPRQINWRATARLGRRMANDFEVDRTGDLLLLLDLRPSGLGPGVDERLLGIAKAGLVGIAGALLRGKVRVGFAAFGEFVSVVPLSTGRAHRIRLERAILSSAPSAVAAPPDRCTFGLRRYFRPGLTTLIVSAWAGDRAFELLPYVQRSGYPALMVSPSPLSLGRGAEASSFLSEESIVRRLESAERRARLGGLWEFGAVIDWTDYWSLDALVRFLRRPMRRRA